jgi:hypothetical protein
VRLSDVALIGERIRRRCRTERTHAQLRALSAYARFEAVLLDDVALDRVRVERAIELGEPKTIRSGKPPIMRTCAFDRDHLVSLCYKLFEHATGVNKVAMLMKKIRKGTDARREGFRDS